MDYLIQANAILPHILFLDLNMPLKSGMDCLKEIKRIDRLKDITIAIYSTSASSKDIEETFIKGANVYIKKPNDFSKLKKVLTEVISTNWQYQSTSGLDKDNFFLSI
jgi:CheY-like chemotaxis protein